MVARCGCTDPVVFGHQRACEHDLGPLMAGGDWTDGSAEMRAYSEQHEMTNPHEQVRRWYDRVLEWSARFDRRYSELKGAEMELHGHLLP